MFSFHFGKKKRACHFNKKCTMLCIVDQKVFIIEDVVSKGIPLLSACSLQQTYPHVSGLQKKSEVIFY